MRKETRLIKSILKSEYPDSHISIRFSQACNYVDSSDKLVVTIDNASFADVYTTLKHYTQGISIYPSNKIVARSGLCNPKILNVNTKEWENTDCLEFVEINIKKSGTP